VDAAEIDDLVKVSPAEPISRPRTGKCTTARVGRVLFP
jgi:hypothetical protein